MSNGYKEANIEAPKPSMFKGTHDVQEVEIPLVLGDLFQV